jgi:hypothetical protein
MLHGTSQVLRIAAMLALSLTIPGSSLSQSTLFGERTEIVRAVLKAERERQAREFGGVNQLSTEVSQHSVGPACCGFQFTLLTPEIKGGQRVFRRALSRL